MESKTKPIRLSAHAAGYTHRRGFEAREVEEAHPHSTLGASRISALAMSQRFSIWQRMERESLCP